MRFTVCLRGRRPWPELLAAARHAAATGWDGIWFGDDAEPALECWATLGALAAAVPDVRLGALVSVDRGRHPAVVAKQATTVDLLSRGRVVVGLVGGPGPDSRARLEETCQVMTRLVAEDRTTLDGRFYQLHDAPLDPKPVQRPLPILIRDGDATTAARYANVWSLTGPPEAVAGQIGSVRRLCRDLGRNPAGLTFAAWGGRTELLERYQEAGVDEWIVPEAAPDVLDGVISRSSG